MNVARITTQRRHDPLEQMMQQFFRRPGPEIGGDELSDAASSWVPAANVAADGDGYTFTFDLPGVPREDIAVDLENGVLTVSGERKESFREGEGSQLYRQETYYGRFARSFKLPGDADTTSVEAKHSDGVISVRVGKKQTVKARRIEIA